MARKIKDLEFAVDDAGGDQRIFGTFAEAAGFALVVAISTGQTVNVDVLAFSERAARAWAGDDGGETYREDPEASVFQRIEIRANDLGRIA